MQARMLAVQCREGPPGGAVGADGVAERDFLAVTSRSDALAAGGDATCRGMFDNPGIVPGLVASNLDIPAGHVNFNDGRDSQRSLSA